jgi:uncharacterized protein (DUF1330 family)
VAAYVIANVTVHDPEAYRAYTAVTPKTIADHGGRFISRGGDVEVLEGDWRPSRLVIIEFPSIEAARAWYTSPEYEEAKELRLATSDSQLVLTDAGVLPS